MFHPRFSRLGAALAVCAIIACVVFVVRMQPVHRVQKATEVRPNRMLELMARYVVGVQGMMQTVALGGQQPNLEEALVQNLTQLAHGRADELRVRIVKGWLAHGWPEKAYLDAIAAKDASLQADVAALEHLKTSQGDLLGDDWKKLKGRHGWIADLARAQSLPEKSEARQVVMQQAMGTAVVLIGVTMLGMAAAALGLGVLIWGFMRWRGGKLHLTLAKRSRDEGGVMTEAFAIFLALFVFAPWLLKQCSLTLPRWATYGPAFLALLAAVAWPLLRGMGRAAWRDALGLHCGLGWGREMRAGVFGWVATLPLLAAGLVAASWIMRLTGEFPGHPIVDSFASDGWAKLGAILLAVVWAPVTEELVFRGLLFPGLSAWLRWVPGVLLSAFVFAVIHPQGWAGVPAIMALASSFAFLRMWRRSLIAPMTAHALNNGIMCVVMLLLWR